MFELRTTFKKYLRYFILFLSGFCDRVIVLLIRQLLVYKNKCAVYKNKCAVVILKLRVAQKIFGNELSI